MERLSSPSRESVIDEFGELDRLVTDFAPKARRHRQLQDQIRSWYQNEPAGQEFTAMGDLYKVHISARSEERKLGIKGKLAIFAKIHKARFVEICSLTLETVKSEMGELFLEDHVTKARTGSRKLIAVLKSAASNAA